MSSANKGPDKGTKQIVYVCVGKDCRDDRRRHKALLKALEGRALIREVGCQKICDGPVCGLKIDGNLQWFEEIDGSNALGALVKLVEGGKVGKALTKRRVKKRRGKLR